MWPSLESGANLPVQTLIVHYPVHYCLAIPIQSSVIKTERGVLKMQDKRLRTRVNKHGSKWVFFHDVLFKTAVVVVFEKPWQKAAFDIVSCFNRVSR